MIISKNVFQNDRYFLHCYFAITTGCMDIEDAAYDLDCEEEKVIAAFYHFENDNPYVKPYGLKRVGGTFYSEDEGVDRNIYIVLDDKTIDSFLRKAVKQFESDEMPEETYMIIHESPHIKTINFMFLKDDDFFHHLRGNKNVKFIIINKYKKEITLSRKSNTNDEEEDITESTKETRECIRKYLKKFDFIDTYDAKTMNLFK